VPKFVTLTDVTDDVWQDNIRYSKWGNFDTCTTTGYFHVDQLAEQPNLPLSYTLLPQPFTWNSFSIWETEIYNLWPTSHSSRSIAQQTIGTPNSNCISISHLYFISWTRSFLSYQFLISIEVLCSIHHSQCQLWTRIILVRRLQSFPIWESNWDLQCVAVKRIMQEARELANDPSTDYSAAPLEEDIFVRTLQAIGFCSHRSVDERRLTKILSD